MLLALKLKNSILRKGATGNNIQVGGNMQRTSLKKWAYDSLEVTGMRRNTWMNPQILRESMPEQIQWVAGAQPYFVVRKLRH